ncbi:hypothetical protein [uncultured Bartonella sp.]|uniref:hypothetical protein n=1 Tax=uncultured Bartonella sp. TaxID=104108 RepID=UPI0025FDA798|nr:hypothetical protein [uncultured Bartonella sp.]
MEKFKVEADDFPQLEIEAEDAENAAGEYCGVLQMDEQMIKNRSDEEYILVLDEKGQETGFKAEIIDRNLELTKKL